MTEPIRLFDGRLQIDTTLAPQNPTPEIGLADSVDAAATRATAPALDLFDGRPGVRFRLGATATSGVGADSVLRGMDQGTALGRTPSLRAGADLSADPLLRRSPVAAASASFELSYTPPNQPNETYTVRANASAALSTSGVDAAMQALTPLLNDAATFETAARGAATALTQELSYFQGGAEIQALRAAIATGNRQRILDAAGPVLEHLQQTERMLRGFGGIFDQAEALISRIEAAPRTLQGFATSRGAVELDRTVRYPIAEGRIGDVSARLTGALTVGVVIPQSAPQALPAVPGMAPLRSLMASVSFLARANTTGLSELSALIAEARGFTSIASNLVRSPLRYANPSEAAQGQATLAELNERGNALSARAATVLAGLGARIETGARVEQATGPGIGLRAAGLLLEGTIGERVDFSVAVTLHNLVGFLPGETANYALVRADDGSFLLGQLGATTSGNVFYRFMPPRVSVDGSLRVRGNHGSLELRAGADGSAAGTSAYVGLISRIRSFYMATSVVVPDVNRPEVLPPQFMLGLGIETRHVSVSLSGGADQSLLSGHPAGTRGAHGSLSFSYRF